MLSVRRLWLGVALVIGGALAVLFVVAFALLPRSSTLLKAQIVRSLAAHLNSDVDVAAVRVSVLPSWRVDVTDLVITPRDRQGVPPLIRVKALTATGSWLALLKRHVSDMKVSGLEINIPPSSSRVAVSKQAPRAASDGEVAFDGKDFVIDRLSSTDARFIVMPDSIGKQPKI